MSRLKTSGQGIQLELDGDEFMAVARAIIKSLEEIRKSSPPEKLRQSSRASAIIRRANQRAEILLHAVKDVAESKNPKQHPAVSAFEYPDALTNELAAHQEWLDAYKQLLPPEQVAGLTRDWLNFTLHNLAFLRKLGLPE